MDAFSAASVRARIALVAGREIRGAAHLSRWLEASGYEVRTVADPFHALVAIESDPDVDLLISDGSFGAGQPDGAALAAAAHEIRESVSVVCVDEDAEDPGRELRSFIDRLGRRAAARRAADAG